MNFKRIAVPGEDEVGLEAVVARGRDWHSALG